MRRVAVKCFANLAQHDAAVIACGSTLALEGNAGVGQKLPNLASDSERIKLLMLYCLQADDVFLV